DAPRGGAPGRARLSGRHCRDTVASDSTRGHSRAWRCCRRARRSVGHAPGRHARGGSAARSGRTGRVVDRVGAWRRELVAAVETTDTRFGVEFVSWYVGGLVNTCIRTPPFPNSPIHHSNTSTNTVDSHM